MKLYLYVILLAGFSVAQPAKAQTISGNDLHEACTSDDQAMAAFCVGYLIGQIEGQFLGGLLFSQSAEDDIDTESFNSLANIAFQHCIPPDVLNSQLRDVVVRYLQDNPATRHETARFLVLEAYRDAFTCP
ncbi:Rap1a/Tai family immunity protein [Yoonia sp. MH D7]